MSQLSSNAPSMKFRSLPSEPLDTWNEEEIYRRFSRLIPPARQCDRSDRERILCSGEGPPGWAVVKAHVSVLRGSAGGFDSAERPDYLRAKADGRDARSGTGDWIIFYR